MTKAKRNHKQHAIWFHKQNAIWFQKDAALLYEQAQLARDIGATHTAKLTQESAYRSAQIARDFADLATKD